jgi:hypothetical protein
MTDELKGDYSPMEKIIFGVLRQKEVVTTEMLLRKVYRRKDHEPFNAGIVINRAVTTLGEKLKRNGEAFRLERKRRPPGRLIENRLKKIKETA